MRINTEIMSLKELLPECREVECNKASILHCTVQTLKRLQVTTTQLALTNAKLEKDNKKIIKMNKRLYEEVIKLRAAMGESVPNISAFEERDESNEQEDLFESSPSSDSSDSAVFPQYVQQSSPLPQMEVHGEISIPMTAMALAEQALPSTEYGAVPSFAAYPSLPTDFAAPTKSYTYTESATSDAVVSSSFPAHSSSFDFSAADFNMMPAFNNYNASLMFVLFFTVPFLVSESTGPALTQLTSAGTSRTLNWLSTAADSTFTFTPSAIVLALAALCFAVVLVCWAVSLRGWYKQSAQHSSIHLPVRRRKSARTSFWSSVARVFGLGSPVVESSSPVMVKKIEI